MTSQSQADPRREFLHSVYAAEAAVWSGMTLLAIVLFTSTLFADFPARPRALIGEVVFGTLALVGAGMAVARIARGQALLTGRWRWSGSRFVQCSLVVCRVSVGMPVVGIGLISAAAGFAA